MEKELGSETPVRVLLCGPEQTQSPLWSPFLHVAGVQAGVSASMVPGFHSKMGGKPVPEAGQGPDLFTLSPLKPGVQSHAK